MLASGRNTVGLSIRQIEYCAMAWTALCGDEMVELDSTLAHEHASRTRFQENEEKVYLGADAYPGGGNDANSRMPTFACLAHELAHAVRFRNGYRRPFELPDVLIDEAETSLNASFASVLGMKDREDLVEDARDRLIHWLSIHQSKGASDGEG
jgi:hypothetical protein